MEERKELEKVYGLMEGLIYISVWIEIVVFVDFGFSEEIMGLLWKMGKIGMYCNIVYSKVFRLFIIMVSWIGRGWKKDLELEGSKEMIFGLMFGLIMLFGSIWFVVFKEKGESSLEWYNIG